MRQELSAAKKERDDSKRATGQGLAHSVRHVTLHILIPSFLELNGILRRGEHYLPGPTVGVVEAQAGTHLEEVKRLQSQCVTAAAERDAAVSEAARLRPMEGETQSLKEEVAFSRRALGEISELERSLKQGHSQLEARGLLSH